MREENIEFSYLGTNTEKLFDRLFWFYCILLYNDLDILLRNENWIVDFLLFNLWFNYGITIISCYNYTQVRLKPWNIIDFIKYEKYS